MDSDAGPAGRCAGSGSRPGVGRKNRQTCRPAKPWRTAPEDEPVLILAPVYAGQMHGAVKALVGEYSDTLRRHPLALGLTSLYQGEQAREELMNCYPPALVAHAQRQFLIGGRIRPVELPFLVRAIVKKITGNDTEIDTLNREMAGEIAAWLREPTAAGPEADA